jgi:hypothetical protein
MGGGWQIDIGWWVLAGSLGVVLIWTTIIILILWSIRRFTMESSVDTAGRQGSLRRYSGVKITREQANKDYSS